GRRPGARRGVALPNLPHLRPDPVRHRGRVRPRLLLSADDHALDAIQARDLTRLRRGLADVRDVSESDRRAGTGGDRHVADLGDAPELARRPDVRFADVRDQPPTGDVGVLTLDRGDHGRRADAERAQPVEPQADVDLAHAAASDGDAAHVLEALEARTD